MLKGFAGRILHVDLMTGQIHVETPADDFYRTYWGGSAMGAYYLLKYTPVGADPLGPENTLCFMLSAATGVAVSGKSRCTATAKSPLTGVIGDSQAGGFWPAELKFAGFDGIVITGKSPSPVYLWIHDGEAELRDAGHLWGKVTARGRGRHQARAGRREDRGGPGGTGRRAAGSYRRHYEHEQSRAHGRTGMGAVMGSKNLKAIARARPWPGRGRRPGRGNPFSRAGAKSLPEHLDVQGMQDYGTASSINFQNTVGGLPTRNFTSGYFEEAENLSGETMTDTILESNDTCYACVVRCKRRVQVEYKGRQAIPFYGGPEYETLSTLGSYCCVGDMAAVAVANQTCAEYGLDTISCGAIISFAMECFERGILTLEDTGGIDLRFGNADALVAITDQIARREGLGNMLAEGSVLAAARIGRGADALAIAVKGSEIPAHMPQVKASLGVIYAINPFGADHQSSEHDPFYAPGTGGYYAERLAELGLADYQPELALTPEKVRFAMRTQWMYSFCDTATICQFVFGPAWRPVWPTGNR